MNSAETVKITESIDSVVVVPFRACTIVDFQRLSEYFCCAPRTKHGFVVDGDDDSLMIDDSLQSLNDSMKERRKRRNQRIF